jgi:hypothetical protein
MLYLILLTFIVFVIFWFGDLILTLKTTKYVGRKVEINPFMRLIIRVRGKFIYLFKIVELGVFLYLIWFLTTFEEALPFYILLAFIFVYGLFVANNAHVYYKVTNKESGVFKLVYICLIIAMLFFIYLNYLLYLDLGTYFGALSQSNIKYNALYWECTANKTINASMPQEISSILESLNLSIRRGSE